MAPWIAPLSSVTPSPFAPYALTSIHGLGPLIVTGMGTSDCASAPPSNKRRPPASSNSLQPPHTNLLIRGPWFLGVSAFVGDTRQIPACEGAVRGTPISRTNRGKENGESTIRAKQLYYDATAKSTASRPQRHSFAPCKTQHLPAKRSGAGVFGNLTLPRNSLLRKPLRFAIHVR
jgi:hypothetical protein